MIPPTGQISRSGPKLASMEDLKVVNPILYLGDGSMDGAAAYLSGVMAHYDLDYEHRPSSEPLDSGTPDRNWSVIVISDYPAANISPEIMSRLVEQVADGTGLIMLGGWDSFQGQGGDYHGSAIGNILPVLISPDDDRVNSSGPCLIFRGAEHPITDGLPFDKDSPGIGGFNRFKAKAEAEVLLESRRYTASIQSADGDRHRLTALPGPDPLLVSGQYGNGRVCAWASDVAPHWVGGLVDWGPDRIEARGHGKASAVEVGNLYAEFFVNLLRWTAGVKLNG